MKRYLALLASIAIVIVSLKSCRYDIAEDLYPNTDCDTTQMSLYAMDVLPIIQSNCYGCHDSNTGKGGITVEPYEALKDLADNGQLSCVINHNPDCSAMPKNQNKLNDCDIAKIDKWIEDGAQNN